MLNTLLSQLINSVGLSVVSLSMFNVLTFVILKLPASKFDVIGLLTEPPPPLGYVPVTVKLPSISVSPSIKTGPSKKLLLLNPF